MLYAAAPLMSHIWEPDIATVINESLSGQIVCNLRLPQEARPNVNKDSMEAGDWQMILFTWWSNKGLQNAKIDDGHKTL